MIKTLTKPYWCPKHDASYRTKDGFCPICKSCTHKFKKLNEKFVYCGKCLIQRIKFRVDDKI